MTARISIRTLELMALIRPTVDGAIEGVRDRRQAQVPPGMIPGHPLSLQDVADIATVAAVAAVMGHGLLEAVEVTDLGPTVPPGSVPPTTAATRDGTPDRP